MLTPGVVPAVAVLVVVPIIDRIPRPGSDAPVLLTSCSVVGPCDGEPVLLTDGHHIVEGTMDAAGTPLAICNPPTQSLLLLLVLGATVLGGWSQHSLCWFRQRVLFKHHPG